MGKKETINVESGHSMIEMLGALMIMGLLGITMIVGTRVAFNKLKANQIIKDARLSHTMLLTDIQRQAESTDWRDILFSSNSGKYVQNRFRDGRPQTKILDVDQAVCEKLMDFNEIASFYVADETGLHGLESCTENQDIVIILDMGQGEEVATGCVTKDDCTNGYCEDRACVTCPEGEAVNEEGTGCTIFCNDDQAVCDDGDIGHTWCCPKEQCTPEYPKCAVTDGKCSWEFTKYPPQTDCTWKFSQKPPKADCTITIIYNSDFSGTLQTNGCSDDQYCYVRFTDSDCDETNHLIQNDSVGTLHGVCNPRTTATTVCLAETTMEEIDACKDSGQYCYLYYTEDNCSTDALLANNTTGLLRGVCNLRTTNNSTCISQVTVREKLFCPSGYYCNLKWTTNDASCSEVQNGDFGQLYGICLARTTATTSCPYNQ